MKIRLSDLRKIIREAAELGMDLAVVVKSTSGGIKATVYDPVVFEDLVLDSPDVLSAGPAALMSCVVGRVRVTEPDDPCWGAMMIASIAGPGKLMYGLAYALSPSGLLISDRESMTADAVSAWRNMSAKTSRDKKKLDNVKDPKTPEPEDDCVLRPEEFLNYAYESEGWERGVLSSMQAEHEQLVKRLTTGGDISRVDVERSLMTAGHEFFQKQLDAAVKRQGR